MPLLSGEEPGRAFTRVQALCQGTQRELSASGSGYWSSREPMLSHRQAYRMMRTLLANVGAAPTAAYGSMMSSAHDLLGSEGQSPRPTWAAGQTSLAWAAGTRCATHLFLHPSEPQLPHENTRMTRVPLGRSAELIAAL